MHCLQDFANATSSNLRRTRAFETELLVASRCFILVMCAIGVGWIPLMTQIQVATMLKCNHTCPEPSGGLTVFDQCRLDPGRETVRLHPVHNELPLPAHHRRLPPRHLLAALQRARRLLGPHERTDHRNTQVSQVPRKYSADFGRIQMVKCCGVSMIINLITNHDTKCSYDTQCLSLRHTP